MEHKKKILTDFNTVLDEFIEKMILQFPEESKLKSYKSAYNVTKMYDKSMPIKVAMGGMLPFKTQIKDRDEDFFKSRETFLEKAVVASSFSNDLGLVNYWDNLSENSKTAIWEYIQTLFVLGEMYINNDSEVMNKIHRIYNNFSFSDSIDVIEKNNTFTEEFINKINK